MSCSIWIFQELKLKYYQLMIELDEHEGSYLAICKHYRAVYETPEIKEDKDKMREVIYILYYMFKKVSLDKQMSEILYKVIISVKLKECQSYL